jgi:hypothetical protein
VAQYRRDRRDDDIPPELIEHDPRRWSAYAWSQARFEWLLARPGRKINGAGIIDVIFEQEDPKTGDFQRV